MSSDLFGKFTINGYVVAAKMGVHIPRVQAYSGNIWGVVRLVLTNLWLIPSYNHSFWENFAIALSRVDVEAGGPVLVLLSTWALSTEQWAVTCLLWSDNRIISTFEEILSHSIIYRWMHVCSGFWIVMRGAFSSKNDEYSYALDSR